MAGGAILGQSTDACEFYRGVKKKKAKVIGLRVNFEKKKRRRRKKVRILNPILSKFKYPARAPCDFFFPCAHLHSKKEIKTSSLPTSRKISHVQQQSLSAAQLSGIPWPEEEKRNK